MQDCNACYCIAVAYLIKHAEDASGAVTAAKRWASTSANTDVQQWLEDSGKPGLDSDCQELIGFVNWGVMYAFR